MTGINRLYSIPANSDDAAVQQLVGLILGDFGIEEGVDPADVGTTDTPATSATTDAAGLPHNPAIHSETPAVTDKGFWRMRRGGDKAAYAKYQAEHNARMTTATAATTVTPTLPALPSLPPLAGTTTLPPLPGANVRTAYHDLADFLVANTAPAGRLNNEWLAAMWQQNKLTGLADLADKPERATEILEALKGVLGQ